jgi:hypothetical protein
MDDHLGPASIYAAGNWQNSVEGFPHANVIVIREPILLADNGPPAVCVMDLGSPDTKGERVVRQRDSEELRVELHQRLQTSPAAVERERWRRRAL